MSPGAVDPAFSNKKTGEITTQHRMRFRLFLVLRDAGFQSVWWRGLGTQPRHLFRIRQNASSSTVERNPFFGRNRSKPKRAAFRKFMSIVACSLLPIVV